MSPPRSSESRRTPSDQQAAWLRCGMDQPGGKLPLFDAQGRRVNPRTIRSCIDAGWAERWFANPLKPEWLVCRLTDSGRAMLTARSTVIEVDFRAEQGSLFPPLPPAEK
ncbi:MAG TPA: hypothetical protein VD978_14850 [Azospirillum sp.]|nr:hypothetical protein [Azospirillum sp.]